MKLIATVCLLALTVSLIDATENKQKCSIARKHKGETFQKMFKTGLVWLVKDTPKDWTPRNLYVQTEKVGDKVMPWIDKNMLYVMPGGATSYGLDCRMQKHTYLCHFLCNAERSRDFIVVYGKDEEGNKEMYRVTLEKSVQGEGKKSIVYLKSVEKANTKGLDEKLDFTIRKPTAPIYFKDEVKPPAELTKSWAEIIDLPTWEQYIMHADETRKFDKVNKRANKLLKDNSKAQENAFFAAAAKKEKAFFAESKKEIYEEGNKVVWKQNDDKKVEKRRRLLESKGKGAKIQC